MLGLLGGSSDYRSATHAGLDASLYGKVAFRREGLANSMADIALLFVRAVEKFYGLLMAEEERLQTDYQRRLSAWKAAEAAVVEKAAHRKVKEHARSIIEKLRTARAQQVAEERVSTLLSSSIRQRPGARQTGIRLSLLQMPRTEALLSLLPSPTSTPPPSSPLSPAIGNIPIPSPEQPPSVQYRPCPKKKEGMSRFPACWLFTFRASQ